MKLLRTIILTMLVCAATVYLMSVDNFPQTQGASK